MLRFRIPCLLLVTVGVAFGQMPPECSEAMPDVDETDCCDMPVPFEQKMWTGCGSEDSVEADLAQPGECIGDCLFREAKLLTGAKVNPEAVKTNLYIETKGNATWAPVVQTAISKCTKTHDKYATSIGDCKTNAGPFILCTHLYLIANCPATMWLSTPDCEKIKKYSSLCTQYPPPNSTTKN